MRNLIFSLILFPASGFGQLIAPDFTLTDIDGHTHNLYQETDAGKTIVLDFFSTICGTCITNTPVLENIWQTYGFQGDSLWVWGIESTGISDSMIHIFEDTYSSTFPLFGTSNDDIVIPLYSITYTPQYLVVCPDRTMKSYSIGNVAAGISSCSMTFNDKKEINPDINIYAFRNEIFIENTGKKVSNVTLEISDLSGKTIAFTLNIIPLERTRMRVKLLGIVFYRLFDSSENLIERGELFLEQDFF